jgi:hypothetical protein
MLHKTQLRDTFVQYCYNIHRIDRFHKELLPQLRKRNIEQEFIDLMNHIEFNDLSNSALDRNEQYLMSFFGRGQYILFVKPAFTYMMYYMRNNLLNEEKSLLSWNLTLPRPSSTLLDTSVSELKNAGDDDAKFMIYLDKPQAICYDYVSNCLLEVMRQENLQSQVRNGSLSFSSFHKIIFDQYAKQMTANEYKYFDRLLRVLITDQCDNCQFRIVNITTASDYIASKVSSEEKGKQMDWWQRLGYPTIRTPLWARRSDPKLSPDHQVPDYFVE